MDSSPDPKVLSVICTVVSRFVAMAFQSSAFQNAVERADQKYLAETHVPSDVATDTIDLLVLTVTVGKFVRSEVEKRSHENAETD